LCITLPLTTTPAASTLTSTPNFPRNQEPRHKNSAPTTKQSIPTIKQGNGDNIHLCGFVDVKNLIWNVTPQTYPRSLETEMSRDVYQTFPANRNYSLACQTALSCNKLCLAPTRHFRVNRASGSLVVGATLALISFCFLFRQVIWKSAVFFIVMPCNSLVLYRCVGRILSRVGGVNVGGVWIRDYLLTTYTHDSEIEMITVPPLLSTIYKSPQ
jgi:hypothetical protein